LLLLLLLLLLTAMPISSSAAAGTNNVCVGAVGVANRVAGLPPGPALILRACGTPDGTTVVTATAAAIHRAVTAAAAAIQRIRPVRLNATDRGSPQHVLVHRDCSACLHRLTDHGGGSDCDCSGSVVHSRSTSLR